MPSQLVLELTDFLSSWRTTQMPYYFSYILQTKKGSPQSIYILILENWQNINAAISSLWKKYNHLLFPYFQVYKRHSERINLNSTH